MKTIHFLPIISVSFLILTGCSEEPTQVRVHNLNDEKVTLTITPATGTVKTIDAAAGETTPYIEIDPTNGGSVTGSRKGTNPKEIRFSAFAETNYGITLSSGDNPTFSWKKE